MANLRSVIPNPTRRITGVYRASDNSLLTNKELKFLIRKVHGTSQELLSLEDVRVKTNPQTAAYDFYLDTIQNGFITYLAQLHTGKTFEFDLSEGTTDLTLEDLQNLSFAADPTIVEEVVKDAIETHRLQTDPHPNWNGGNLGKVTFNVRSLATGGAGSIAAPYTGWSSQVTAKLTETGGNCTFFFPSGVYEYSTSPNFGRYPNVHYRGEHGTILKYTGTGRAVEFICTNAGIQPGILTQFGIIFENFIIDGSGTGTHGIYSQSMHHSIFRNIGIRNVTEKGFEVNFAVLNHYDTVRVSARVGDADGLGESPTRPTNGFFTNSTAGDAVMQACTFTNLIVENCTGDGVILHKTKQCQFIGGSSEANQGNNLVVEATSDGNTFIGMDNEFPGGTYDFLVKGKRNQFINCLSTATIEMASGAQNNAIIGGAYNNIVVNSNAARTVIDAPGYNLINSGTFTDNSPNTAIRAQAFNIPAGTWDATAQKVQGESYFNENIFFNNTAKGVVLTAPGGGKYRIQVSDAGVLSAVSLGGGVASDNFTGTTMNGQWTLGTLMEDTASALVTVAQNNALSITLPTGNAGNNFRGYLGQNRAFGSANIEQVELLSIDTGQYAGQARFCMGMNKDNKVCFYLELNAGTPILYYTKHDAGVANVVNSTSFSPTTHKFWRFRLSGSNLIAETSADASAWSQLGSTTVSWSPVSVKVSIEAGSYGSLSAAKTIIFDNYIRT